MQFAVGDVVVHPVQGVGRIAIIENKQFSGIDACLYYQIIFPRSSIWVPVESQSAIGLRRLTAKKELDEYRDLIKSRPVLPNNNLAKEHFELANRLKEGSFQTMCEVVRDLTALDWQKPLGAATKTILRKTQVKLYQEWALAAGITVAEATSEINALLRATQNGAVK